MTLLGPQLELKVLQLFQETRSREPNSTDPAIMRSIWKAHFRVHGSDVVKEIISLKQIHRIVVKNEIRKVVLRKRRNNPIDRYEREITKSIADAADLYLDEIQAMLVKLGAPLFSVSTIQRALVRYGLPLRNLQVKALQRDRRRTLESLEKLRSYRVEQLIFLDETHCDDKSSRRRKGRAQRGMSPIVRQKFTVGRYTAIAACNMNGFVKSACKIIALEPGVGVNSQDFLEWVESNLCPSLGSYMHGEANSVVVLDNASVHWGEFEKILDAIRRRGAVVEFLAPYSPEINPIELAFSKMKKGIRRIRGSNRVEYDSDPEGVLARSMDACTADDFTGWFAHCGYEVPRALDEDLLLASAAAAFQLMATTVVMAVVAVVV